MEHRLDVGGEEIVGDLAVPRDPRGVVVFAHGSGSSRHSSRNRRVAARLRAAGLATFLLDLLSAREDALDADTRAFRFDIGLLAERVASAIDHVGSEERTAPLPVGLFGASTGAAAALVAAAARPDEVAAVVSRGGRPDLAGDELTRVSAPTLLIVGGRDPAVKAMNETAMARMSAPVRLEVVPDATHLFEEPGTLERVAELAVDHLAVLTGRDGVRPDPDGAPGGLGADAVWVGDPSSGSTNPADPG